MRIERLVVLLSALTLIACDPKAPVGPDDGTGDVDAKIDTHNNSGTHPNLTIPIDRVVGDIASARIADGTITDLDLAPDSVGSAQILDGSIGSGDLGAGVVTAISLAANAVGTAAIGDAMVTTNKLADMSVTTIKLGDNAVTAAKIVDGTIVTADLADNAVATAKIADMAVTTAKIADAAVDANKLGANAVTSAKIMDGQVTTNDLANLAVDATKIADAAVTTAKIADGAIDDAKLNTDDSGTGTQTAFTSIFDFRNQSGATINNVSVKIICNATNNGAELELFNVTDATSVETISCTNSAVPILTTFTTVNLANNKTFAVRYRVAAGSLNWRKPSVTY